MSLAYYLVLFPIPPRFFLSKSPVSPRFQEDPFELFHNVCIIIQLQESGVELHLLGKRKSINVAVSDIAVYRVTHTLGYVVMRNSGMSKVCCKGGIIGITTSMSLLSSVF